MALTRRWFGAGDGYQVRLDAAVNLQIAADFTGFRLEQTHALLEECLTGAFDGALVQMQVSCNADFTLIILAAVIGGQQYVSVTDVGRFTFTGRNDGFKLLTLIVS